MKRTYRVLMLAVISGLTLALSTTTIAERIAHPATQDTRHNVAPDSAPVRVTSVTSETLYAIADTTVLHGQPDTNYGDRWQLAVGYADAGDPNWPGGEATRSLVRFGTPTVPPGTIVSEATLHLKHSATGHENPDPRTVIIYRATSDWSEMAATWNNQPGLGEAHAALSIDANRYIDIAPTLGWTGTTTVEVRVTDTGGMTDTDDFIVAVGVSAGEAQGIFVDSGQELGNSASQNAALGDLDQDGDLDAFVVNFSLNPEQGQPNTVWLNDGGLQAGTPGVFTDTGQELGTAKSRSVALGDLDGDGDLDAFVANGGTSTPEANAVWMNDGTGIFSASQTLGGFLSIGVALGDLDDDDDLDAFVANWAAPDKVWLNDGDGVFVDSGQNLGYPPGFASDTVALGDVDGDGDLDAVVGRIVGHPSSIYLNDGSGTFTESGADFGSDLWITAIELVDVDGDDDLDAVTSTEINATLVWANDGSGVFTNTGQSIGPWMGGGIAAGDIDGDGETDLFTSNEVWLNDGTGVFSASSQNGVTGYTLSTIGGVAVALGDVDGDGDLDAFGALDGPNRIWLNRNVFYVTHVSPPNALASVAPGSPLSATLSLPVNASTVSTRSFTVLGSQTGLYSGTYFTDPLRFDVTESFKPGEDIWISLSPGLRPSGSNTALVPYVWGFRVATAAAPGTFLNSGQALGDGVSQDVALGDVDGDGDLDALVGNYDAGDAAQENRLWLNTGGHQGGVAGSYVDSGQSIGDPTGIIALGDLDGDGDLDAFVGYEVWLNDGTGLFVDSGFNLSETNINALALGDMDGDGDLDAVVANWVQADRVWLNDGHGAFTVMPQMLAYPPGKPSWDVVLGDLDDDGDLDAIITTYSQGTNDVWLNDGLGVLIQGDSLGDTFIQDIELGDVDSDGDLDAVAVTSTAATQVWKNDGTGNFIDSGQSLGTLSSRHVALGDVDGDSDLDAVINNSIWTNNGTGVFSLGFMLLQGASPPVVALGDLDGDSDLDAFVGSDGPNQVWLNQEIYYIYLPMVLKSFGP